MVGAADPKSGRPENKSLSAELVLGSPYFNSSAAIANAIYIFFLFICLYFFRNIYTNFKTGFSIDLLYLFRDETISLFRKCCNSLPESP